ncbi:hypothetical protein JG687_00015725 [Phytophthora cactorum]|uniref:Uncharacterized protein n=1 Tax=Phytophthora cactorum TaxID=29920 RepID=A0A8T1TTX3_9STRA|nr:hypothetical protein JG687_00015725 [Phytophthora cactorum]
MCAFMRVATRKFLIGLHIVSVIIACYFCFTARYDQKALEQIRKRIRAGNNSYRVHKDLEDPEGAAQVMGKLHTTATTLINYFANKYPSAIDKIISNRQQTVIRGINDL